MSATKILWGQILVVALIILATTWGATEWTAWRLGFQAQLGAPWFILFGWPVYYPPSFYAWWFFYDAYAPAIFVEGAYIAASGGFMAIAAAIAMSVWRAREAKYVDTYGSARCQSARKFDPVSASNFDPFARRDLRVALDSSELAGIGETRRARAA